MEPPLCANPQEMREGTSGLGQASSPNLRLPSQVLYTKIHKQTNFSWQVHGTLRHTTERSTQPLTAQIFLLHLLKMFFVWAKVWVAMSKFWRLAAEEIESYLSKFSKATDIFSVWLRQLQGLWVLGCSLPSVFVVSFQESHDLFGVLQMIEGLI